MQEKQRLPNYGGQALIEGVLMRGGNSLAAAFRKPSGEIIIRTEKLSGIYTGGLRDSVFTWLNPSLGCTWSWNALPDILC